MFFGVFRHISSHRSHKADAKPQHVPAAGRGPGEGRVISLGRDGPAFVEREAQAEQRPLQEAVKGRKAADQRDGGKVQEEEAQEGV